MTCERKLARIEHVLIVKVYFERRKIVKVFVTHVQDSFWKSLSAAAFERKISSVSLPLLRHLGTVFLLSRCGLFVMMHCVEMQYLYTPKCCNGVSSVDTDQILMSADYFLWPPYVIGGALYFCPVVSFLLSSFYLLFFSSPNLSGRRSDVCHTSTHGVALVRI